VKAGVSIPQLIAAVLYPVLPYYYKIKQTYINFVHGSTSLLKKLSKEGHYGPEKPGKNSQMSKLPMVILQISPWPGFCLESSDFIKRPGSIGQNKYLPYYFPGVTMN
jgi:hypothetical protein